MPVIVSCGGVHISGRGNVFDEHEYAEVESRRVFRVRTVELIRSSLRKSLNFHEFRDMSAGGRGRAAPSRRDHRLDPELTSAFSRNPFRITSSSVRVRSSAYFGCMRCLTDVCSYAFSGVRLHVISGVPTRLSAQVSCAFRSTQMLI